MFKKSKNFLPAMIALASTGILVEAANNAFNLFPDQSGAGYIFAGVVVALTGAAWLAEKIWVK